MSKFEYRKQFCHKERERDRDLKHCVRSPHRYLTQLTDHENFVENMSKLSLRQGEDTVHRSQRPARQPAPSTSSSHRAAIDACCRGEARARRRNPAASPPKAAAAPPPKAAAPKDRSSRGNHSDLCYPLRRRATSLASCRDKFVWQTGKYVKDECGSGIVPRRQAGSDPRRLWCRTPLTMYQSTIGELARQMLCREIAVPKRVNDSPPCNLCERVMPLCKGYYRKYDCRRSCEEDHAVVKNGQKVYRDPIQQYWMPCLTSEEKRAYDLSKDADHNVYLGKKLKRKIDERLKCW